MYELKNVQLYTFKFIVNCWTQEQISVCYLTERKGRSEIEYYRNININPMLILVLPALYIL